MFSSILEVYANDSNTIIEGNIEDNTIYLGELTFTPDSGYLNFDNKQVDIDLGNLLNI